jgi:anti-sigma-K factor RskA
MSDPGPEGKDPDILAAEHALGVLDPPDRDAAERRAAAEPAFAREVDAWRARLAGLLMEIAPVQPPERVWSRIVRRLGEASNVVEMRLRRSLTVWRGVSAAAMAAAACLAVALFLPRPERPGPLMTSRLAGAASGTASGSATPVVFVAVMDPAHHRVILQPVSILAAPGRSPELWLIANGKPVPLGVATFDRPVQLKLQTAPTGAEVLAVSIEPEGGSPTGQPTGPVVATGKLQAL